MSAIRALQRSGRPRTPAQPEASAACALRSRWRSGRKRTKALTGGRESYRGRYRQRDPPFLLRTPGSSPMGLLCGMRRISRCRVADFGRRSITMHPGFLGTPLTGHFVNARSNSVATASSARAISPLPAAMRLTRRAREVRAACSAAARTSLSVNRATPIDPHQYKLLVGVSQPLPSELVVPARPIRSLSQDREPR